jgi:2-polyprenyl-3-methyl-5-hydroxy-6-metoxy-1,4-benzoquinol methylase
MIEVFQAYISKLIDLIVAMPAVKKELRGKNVEQIISLYSQKTYTRNFVKMRFWYGPLHELNKLVPKSGKILEIGSGEGILANFLAISSPARRIIGIEINKHRIKEANKGIKNVNFINRNALKYNLPSSGVIILSHVLHHLGSKEAQIKILEACYKSLEKKGKLIIADVDRQFSVAYFFGWIADSFLIPIFFEKKFIDLHIYHRSKKEWVSVLRSLGFVVEYQRMTKGRIYPEFIVVANNVNKYLND